MQQPMTARTEHDQVIEIVPPAPFTGNPVVNLQEMPVIAAGHLAAMFCPGQGLPSLRRRDD